MSVASDPLESQAEGVGWVYPDQVWAVLSLAPKPAREDVSDILRHLTLQVGNLVMAEASSLHLCCELESCDWCVCGRGMLIESLFL
jgi:hypothetical protein